MHLSDYSWLLMSSVLGELPNAPEDFAIIAVDYVVMRQQDVCSWRRGGSALFLVDGLPPPKFREAAGPFSPHFNTFLHRSILLPVQIFLFHASPH